MKKNIFLKKGFSLAELGIAMVILLVIATIAVISYFVLIDDSKETRLIETAKTVQAASLMSFAKEGSFGTSDNSILDDINSDEVRKICSALNFYFTDDSGNFRASNSDNGLVLTKEVIEDLDKGYFKTGLLNVPLHVIDNEFPNSSEDSGEVTINTRDVLEEVLKEPTLSSVMNLEEAVSLVEQLDIVIGNIELANQEGINNFFDFVMFMQGNGGKHPNFEEIATEGLMQMIPVLMVTPLAENDFELFNKFNFDLFLHLDDLGYGDTPTVYSVNNNPSIDENPCLLIEEGPLQVNEVDFDQLRNYLGPEVTRDDVEGFYILEIKYTDKIDVDYEQVL